MGTASRVCTSCDTPVPADASFCPTCGAATPTQGPGAIPDDFRHELTAALADRYRIERELGRGGMAVVYLAYDRRHERWVAVKTLRPELAASVGAARFLREIKVAAKLTHQNILALYDSGDAEGFLYYVMPYVDGESLRQKLNSERQLAIDEALRLTREIAEGLEYVHEQGVIHRDIKPENILLSRGHALIADFGIAKALAREGAANLTSTGTSVGTPLYMSPEQAAGDPNLDHRSDLYSLGCMLYEMLAGEPPFTGATAQAVMAKHATEPRPSVRTLRDTVPEAVDAAIMQAMAKAPVDRYGDVAAFAGAIVATSAPPQRDPALRGADTGAGGGPAKRLLHEPDMHDIRRFDPRVQEVERFAALVGAPAPSASPHGARHRSYLNPWVLGSSAAALLAVVVVISTLGTLSPAGEPLASAPPPDVSRPPDSLTAVPPPASRPTPAAVEPAHGPTTEQCPNPRDRDCAARVQKIRIAFQAYDNFLTGDAVRLLTDAMSLSSVSGVDSTWAAGLYLLAQCYLEEGNATAAATWLRWGWRFGGMLSDAPLADTALFLPEVMELSAEAAQFVASTEAFSPTIRPHFRWVRVADGTIDTLGLLEMGIRPRTGGSVEVLIDDRPWQAVSSTMLAAGSHRLTMSLEGGPPVQYTFEVVPGLTTIVSY